MAKWINEKSVDCCFCAKPDRSTVCDWIPISTDELVVWLPETHKKAGWKSFPLADLGKGTVYPDLAEQGYRPGPPDSQQSPPAGCAVYHTRCFFHI